MKNLSPSFVQSLKDLGLKVLGSGNRLLLLKPIGIPGNAIPNWQSQPDHYIIPPKGTQDQNFVSDCPDLRIWLREEKIEVTCWDYVPGPGPGDFAQTFPQESEAYAFIHTYYFEPNPLFQEKSQDYQDSRDGLNLLDLKKLLGEVLKVTADTFGDRDIPLENRPFHQIPRDQWRVKRFQEEEPLIRVGTGFIGTEICRLRRKLSRGESFSAEDLQHVGEVLMALSLRMEES